MKRTKLLLLTLMTMVLSVTTSCLDNDNDNDRISVQVKYDRVFSSVRNSATGTTFNSPETVYTIEIDYTNRLMRIGVNNIRLNQTDDSHTFVLEGVKLTSATTDGALLAEATSLQPVDASPSPTSRSHCVTALSTASTVRSIRSATQSTQTIR